MGRRARARSASAQLAIEPLERRLYLAVAMINWTDVRQTIAGFGSSSAWNNLGNVDSSQQQLLWSTTDGAGLSMLRSRIRPDTSSSSDEIFAMQKAQAMGVTIWSTPWSPPAAWKSNNNIATIVNSVDTMGYLLASHYQDYANWLKQYVINMANNGITIYAVSMQNEPNWSADYESARWSAQQFHDALSVLHDTLASDSRTANVKIILPEEIHWNNLDLVSQVMSDPVESNYTNVIYADHTYGINTIAGGKDGFAPISGLNGHQIWETEHTGDDPGLGITAGLNEAQSIYDIVYIAQASAYHHWWTNATGGAGLLNGQWQTTKLFSAMAQFSKFIRPGWVAVGESDDNNGLRISAFKNPTTGDFASVIVNTGSSAITETIHLNGAYSPVITPWVTTATLDVAQQQSIPATGDGSSFTYTIPAKSIVTLTGTATTTPVTEAPVGLLASGATPSTIALSWTNNLTSATGYTVQRSSDGINWTTLSNTVLSGTYTYTDSGLPANTLYYYRVQANNGTLDSDVVAQMTQPPAPSNLTASYNASTQNVALNWTRNGSSVTDYAVDVSTDGGNTWTTQSAGISSSSSSYTDTAAPELAVLQYRVRAVYGLNSSAPTNIVTVATTVLKAPSGFSVSASGKSAVLKWTDNTTTNSTVSIERATDGTNWAVLTSVNHGVQTYTDSTLSEGGTYYYRIRNYDSTATPPTYSAYATTSAVTVPPASPTHVEVEFFPLPTMAARVLWIDNATSETAYEVDRSSNAGSTWTTLTTTLPPNSTTYTDTTAAAGQSYEYRVAALHDGQSSTSVATLSEAASSLPAPFAHGDIGDAATVGLAGSASYDSSTGTYTLKGAGSDIWSTADGFQFAFTTLAGDGSIVTQVTSMANFVNSGKAGIMMRNSLDPSSAYAIAFLTPQGTVNFEERASSGASSANRTTQGTFSTPEWLKLIRSGNAFSVFYSANGTSWTQLGSSFSISMGSTIYVGLITSAHSSGQLATATFANTALTGAGNQPPTVSTPASANQLPGPNAASANLSVGGADDAGESYLTYSWATTGTPPAPVVFSSNGQNASKNTVATFTKPGNYSFVVTITDQFGLSTSSTVDFTLNQVTNTIVVSPSGATVAPNSQKQFTATAYDQFGAGLTSQQSFTWSTANNNIGSINTTTGLYSATSLQGISTVSATVGAINGSATLNVTSLPAPLAWYRFDESSGSLASDSSGNGKNANLSGNAAFGAGESGNAVVLSGGYASLPTGILSTLTNFTISAWVNVTTLASWARIFDFGTGTTDYMFLTPDAGGTNAIRFGITTSGAGGEQQLNGPAITANNWTHIAVTLVGSTGTLYVNGVAVATNTGMTLHPSTLGNTNQNYFGKSQYADPALQGSIDDVRIFSAGLPAAQITQLYNSYFPPAVATAAVATPATVSATTCQLSAPGASNLGESALDVYLVGHWHAACTGNVQRQRHQRRQKRRRDIQQDRHLHAGRDDGRHVWTECHQQRNGDRQSNAHGHCRFASDFEFNERSDGDVRGDGVGSIQQSVGSCPRVHMECGPRFPWNRRCFRPVYGTSLSGRACHGSRHQQCDQRYRRRQRQLPPGRHQF